MSEFPFHVGTKLKDKHVAKYVDAAQSWLLPGERFVALFWTNSIKPMVNAVVVTNARIAGISNADLQNPTKAFRNAIPLADVKDVQLEKGRFSAGPKVRVVTTDGEQHGYGEIKEDDAEALRYQLESVIAVPSDVVQAASAAADSHKRRLRGIEATYKRLLRRDQRLFGVLELRKLAEEIASDETLVNLAAGTLALDNDGGSRKVQTEVGIMFGRLRINAMGSTAEVRQLDPKERAAEIGGYVREALSASTQAATPPAGDPAPDALEQIKRLAELRDSGIVTAEEFEAKKAELLARL